MPIRFGIFFAEKVNAGSNVEIDDDENLWFPFELNNRVEPNMFTVY